MMTFFNKIGESWVAKGIFSLLALSMIAFWGIGGLSNTVRYTDEAISVGSRRLTSQQLLRLFEQERQKLNGLTGGYISPKKAVELGLVDQVVAQQISSLVNEEIKEKLDLTASDNAVRKYVETNPAFQDALGQFDKNLFYAYLRQMKMTEPELAENLKNELAFRHLAYAVKSLAYAPNEMIKRMYKYQNEKRDVTAVLVETDKIKLNVKPTEEELKEYYEAYADQFVAPEYRSFSALRLMPEMMLDRVEVSDEDIDAVYEEQKLQYQVPEKRDVAQMRFSDEETAKEALKGLTVKNFTKIAADKLGQTEEQTNFGFVTREELLEELMEPVFTAKASQIIGPIESPHGWHILLVREIQKAQVTPEKEIRAKIKTALAQEKTYGAMYELVKQIEDILGAGDSLNRVSEQLNLPLVFVEKVDISGVSVDGKEISPEINNREMIQSLFTIQKSDTTPLIENGTGYIVAQVTDITPVSQKEFASVRPELVRLWTSEKQKDKLIETAESIQNRVKSGTSLSAQSVFGNFKLIRAKNISRNELGELPSVAMNTVFHQKAGDEYLETVETDNGILLVMTNKIIYPDASQDEEGYQRIADELKDTVGDELLAGIISAYQDDIGVKINESEIKRAFSVYSTDID